MGCEKHWHQRGLQNDGKEIGLVRNLAWRECKGQWVASLQKAETNCNGYGLHQIPRHYKLIEKVERLPYTNKHSFEEKWVAKNQSRARRRKLKKQHKQSKILAAAVAEAECRGFENGRRDALEKNDEEM